MVAIVYLDVTPRPLRQAEKNLLRYPLSLSDIKSERTAGMAGRGEAA